MAASTSNGLGMSIRQPSVTPIHNLPGKIDCILSASGLYFSPGILEPGIMISPNSSSELMAGESVFGAKNSQTAAFVAGTATRTVRGKMREIKNFIVQLKPDLKVRGFEHKSARKIYSTFRVFQDVFISSKIIIRQKLAVLEAFFCPIHLLRQEPKQTVSFLRPLGRRSILWRFTAKLTFKGKLFKSLRHFRVFHKPRRVTSSTCDI